jgi:hypothetical protein
MCNKTCRNLLSNLVDKHAYLVSQILVALKDNIESIGLVSIQSSFLVH